MLMSCVSALQAQTGPPAEILVIPVGQFESQPFLSNCLGRAGNAGCYQVNLRMEEGFEVRYSDATREMMMRSNTDLMNIRRQGGVVELTIPVAGGNIEFFHPEVNDLVIPHTFPVNVTGSQQYFRVDINLRSTVGGSITGRVVSSAERSRRPRRDLRSEGRQQQQTSSDESPNSRDVFFGDVNTEEVYEFEMVEQQPELIGGLAELLRRIRYPEQALRAGIQGHVFVEFVVTETGDVTDPVVRRGIGYGADEEAVRVIQQAKFNPGIQNGTPVRVRYGLPVHFRLNN